MELDVGSLDPDQRIEVVVFAPGEPTPQLVGAQGVRVPGVARQVGNGGTLGRRYRIGLERRGVVVVMATTWRWSPIPATARRTRGEALARTLDPRPHRRAARGGMTSL